MPLDDPRTRWLVDRVSVGPAAPSCGGVGLICEYIPRMLRALYNSGKIRSHRVLTFVAAVHVSSDELYVLASGPDGPFLDAWPTRAKHRAPRAAAAWADGQAWRVQTRVRLELTSETLERHEWKAVAPRNRLVVPALCETPVS